MPTSNARPAIMILIILLLGCIIATAISQLFSIILPEGVVKQFFLQSISLGWGDSDGWIDFNIIRFRFGFYIKVSVLSLIGVMTSWYFLRYFR